jgi:ethanolamine ammonia-lyase small subunit
MSNGDLPAPPDAALWARLRDLTAARIGLQRSGASLATAPLLAFQLAHAQARDAVHAELDTARLMDELGRDGETVLTVASAAGDKQTYLMRPDLGRNLAHDAQATLTTHAGRYDVVFVVSGGLSARAVQTHAGPVMATLLPTLRAESWSVAPMIVVRHGRVAFGDAVATLLGASSVVVLIGERPGLSAPHSMGAYLTWQPGAHTTDADRNCISNIRQDGIGYADAAFKLAHLLNVMRKRGVSGIRLKDDSDRLQIGP